MNAGLFFFFVFISVSAEMAFQVLDFTNCHVFKDNM